jgi:hypothetical protein
VVALGIGIDGTKHPLALVEGLTENATPVRDLLVGLRERGLDTTRPILAVLDWSKALSKAVREVFDKPVIQRCQERKIRNVRDRLPEKPTRPTSNVGGTGRWLRWYAAGMVEAAGQLRRQRPPAPTRATRRAGTPLPG